MRTRVQFRTFDEIVKALRSLQFDVREAPEVAKRGATGAIAVSKFGAGAILAPTPLPTKQAKAPTQHAMWIERPGLLLGGSIATLLDKGYQKFWSTPRLEVPATADSLKAVHRFAEELREVIGEVSYYNESLGTTSDRYMYDRVKGRDLPESERHKPVWELPEPPATH